jgi:hypothetical protein
MKLTVIKVLHTVDEGFDAGPLEHFVDGGGGRQRKF